jgi:hypothetical protein
MRRVAVTAPPEARVVAGALLLAIQLQRLAAIVVSIPVYAASVLLASCAVGWRRRPALGSRRPLRARLWQLRRSVLPLYLSLSAVAVALGWIVASH